MQSLTDKRLVLSHSVKIVAHPSSLVRAVNSETLSVGAYASIPAILRKSFTACEAFAALPPTPIMNKRPDCSRIFWRSAANLSIVSGSISRATSWTSDKNDVEKHVTGPGAFNIGGILTQLILADKRQVAWSASTLKGLFQ